jgi:hypothetical protein
MNIAAIARRLGGEVSGGRASVPGPGHSKADRSLRIWYDDQGELAWHSFSPATPWRECADYLRCQGILVDEQQERSAPISRQWEPSTLPAVEDAARRRNVALGIWSEALDPRGTLAELYLRSRAVALPPAGAEAIRFAPALKHGPSGAFWPSLVAAITDARTGMFRAIHRTFLAHDGSGKAPIEGAKMSLGPKSGGVIRLVPDEMIDQRLAYCEGIETGLAAIRAGWPCWAAIDACNMAALPVWPAIDVTIFADHDANGTGQRAADALARRWAKAGGWAEVITVAALGADLNDLAREIAS